MKYTRGQFTNEYYLLWEMGLVIPAPWNSSFYSVKYRKNQFDEYSRVTLRATSVSDALERACYAITYTSPWRPEDIDLHAVYDNEENLLWIDEPFYNEVQKKNEFRGMERREFLARFGATSAAILFGFRPAKARASTSTTVLSGTASGFTPPTGEQVYTSAGSYNWIVPSGITSISVVCIGGGGAGGYHTSACIPSGGGTSSFESLASATGGGAGQNNTSVGGTGVGGAGGVRSAGDGGGNGGSGGSSSSSSAGGGGGAGGYSGNGGNGGNGFSNGQSGSGGGAGGGGGSQGGSHGAAGGGVGLFGVGSNGAGGTAAPTATGGGGGSGGTAGVGGSNLYPGGSYGGGNGGVANSPGAGGGGGGALAYKNNITTTPGTNRSVNVGEGGRASDAGGCFGGYQGVNGAVRIIWGAGRTFPSNAT